MNQIDELNSRKNWHGSLNLVYSKREDTTLVTYSQQQAPLKVQRPFYPEGKQICHSVVLHTAGGIVGGDQLTQNIHLHANSQSLITTAAASKIYRSNGEQARQRIQIKIEPGAILEWLPQETIVFNQANYHQDLRVELAPEACWLGWEIVRFGRTARNEKFVQGEWRNYTEVWQNGQPLWIDRQWLPGSEATFHHPHGLAGKPIVGTLIWLGKPVTEEIVTKVRNIWNPETTSDAGVTTTQGEGLLCRYRGSAIAEVRNWFKEVWHLLRLYHLERPPIKPRIWQL
ncbi:MAG: urease accessory protein UreD [Oscillatoria sp. PMC 1068.18]|nr:urease accessory protein UreD [Oscillatoria sp. PMC 1076.18]MEC4987960.1 urease accessory protein UreD [Oscillatoria sp. PMC 1068.18]